MNELKKIIIIDDEEFIRLNFQRIFDEEKYLLTTFEKGEEGIKYLKENEADIAFLDLNLPDLNGIEVLKEIKKNQPDLLVIVITGYASVESAVNAIKLGAYDYIKKPFKADAIKLITKLALETQLLKKKVRELTSNTSTESTIDSIIGISDEVRLVKSQIEQFAKYDEETVLITGESGVGKELVAKSIHQESPRKNKPFVEINCASIPENLLESELFGHERGAFTDAREKKVGLIEKADKGTIFLDEIGEMSISLQSKLLRMLESKEIRKVGSTENQKVDVRIIAATNKNLLNAIEEKEFRRDLYYRLNVLRINVPKLKERTEDIPLLTEFFIEHYNYKFKKSVKGISDKARRIIMGYDWPGNVRELKNFIERTVILTKNEFIDIDDLPAEWHEITFEEPDCFIAMVDIEKSSLDEIVQNFEAKIIIEAFKNNGENVSQTARQLKIPRETLRYKLSKHEIKSGEK